MKFSRYLQDVPQTDGEKVEMYKKCSIEELAKMHVELEKHFNRLLSDIENDRSPELKIGQCFQFDKWDTDNGFDFSEDKYSYVEYNGHMDGSSPLITSEKFYCNKYDEKT